MADLAQSRPVSLAERSHDETLDDLLSPRRNPLEALADACSGIYGRAYSAEMRDYRRKSKLTVVQLR